MERSRKAMWWKGAVALIGAATVAIVGLVGTTSQVEAAKAPADQYSIAVECNVFGTQLHLAAWNCPSPDGAYFGWWLTPEATEAPAGYPTQPQKIQENGSFNNDLGRTLDFIMAFGSRGQVAYTAPWEWQVRGARRFVEKEKSSSGKTAIDYVKEQVNSPNACPGDVSVALAGRVGYVMNTVGEDPETVAAADGRNCNLVEIVEQSFNPATGQYGTTFEDTIWSVNLLTGIPKAPANADQTAGWIKSQASPSGSWNGDDGRISFQRTGQAILALVILGVNTTDPAILAAVDDLAAHQNDDGGFGYLYTAGGTAAVQSAPPAEPPAEPQAEVQAAETAADPADEPSAEAVASDTGDETADTDTDTTPEEPATTAATAPDEAAEAQAETPVAEVQADGPVQRSTSIETAYVHGALRALSSRGAHAYWTKFTNGPNGQTGRMGIETLLGIVMQNQKVGFYDPATGDGEGRFYAHVGSIDEDPATPDETQEEISDTQHTSVTVFNMLFWDPIQPSGALVPAGGTTTPPAAAPTAVVATPTATG